MLKIIYEDHDILVAEKPAGLESQASRGFEPDMVSEIKNHLKRAELSRLSTKPSTKSSTRPVEPYVGVIHRLDKPVGGIMVYAKNQKAAASLSKQVQDGRMKKIYNAVVCGKLVDIVGNYVDYLLKDEKENVSRIVDMGIKGGKRAELICRVLESKTVEPYGELTLADRGRKRDFPCGDRTAVRQAPSNPRAVCSPWKSTLGRREI